MHRAPYVSFALGDFSVSRGLAKRLIAFLLKSCGWTLDADQALVVKLLVASSAAPIHAARREGTNCYRND